VLEHNHGYIVTIASIAGFIDVSGLVDDCSSNFATVGLHETLT